MHFLRKNKSKLSSKDLDATKSPTFMAKQPDKKESPPTAAKQSPEPPKQQSRQRPKGASKQNSAIMVHKKLSRVSVAAKKWDEKAPSEEAESRPMVELKDGDVITGNSKVPWKVVRELGKGGFGKVLEVYADGVRSGIHLACKVEARNEDVHKRNLRLKMEAAIMMAIQMSAPEKKRHFTELVDRGKDKDRGFKFVVMTMLGPSLNDLRKQLKRDNVTYSKATCAFIARQTLEAIHDFHEIGYVHRDIKPHNFAIGKFGSENTIFLYDFGIARRLYEADQKTLRKARPDGTLRFCGTPRYASIRCHQNSEQGRRDDCESWLYMVYDFFDPDQGLVWRKMPSDSDKDLLAITKFKTNFMRQEKNEELYNHFCFDSEEVPARFGEIKDLVKELTYESRPPYEKMAEIVAGIQKEIGEVGWKAEWIGRKLDFQVVPAEKENNSRDALQKASF